MSIENILKYRDFVRNFTNEIPEQNLVKTLIEKTFYYVPSKANLVPYKVNILGPDCIEIKNQIYQQTKRKIHKSNPNIQLLAPYVLVFTSRLVKPNKRISNLLSKGHKYNVCNKDIYDRDRVLKGIMIEIGKFSMILNMLCIENDIDCAYTLCHFEKPQNQKIFDDKVLYIMSLGYRKYFYTRAYKKKLYEEIGEIKPDVDEIIIWK